MSSLAHFVAPALLVFAVPLAGHPLPVGKTYVSAPPVPSPNTCHIRGLLPDPTCTPGATNPAVTPADLDSTICSRGWTEKVRPPESYTEPLKLRQMSAYGDKGSPRLYEEDHLVPLELGGAPTDPHNLWPEPGASPNAKDKVEDAARRAVCDHRMVLATAQELIASNWVALGRRLGISEQSGRSTGAFTLASEWSPVNTQVAAPRKLDAGPDTLPE